MSTRPAPLSTRPAPLRNARRHLRTDRMKALAASALAQKVGYLRYEDLPGAEIFDTLPTRSFNPRQTIRPKEELFLLVHGAAEVWHAGYETLVKALEPGALFGEMPLLGQSMLMTKAVAGTPGATLAVMDEASALKWLGEQPTEILRLVGSRLAKIEDRHYRSQFQLMDSRLAALLLMLAGDARTIVGLSHEQMGEMIGAYRETVTILLDAMKREKLIEIARKKVTILDKRALRELSDL